MVPGLSIGRGYLSGGVTSKKSGWFFRVFGYKKLRLMPVQVAAKFVIGFDRVR